MNVDASLAGADAAALEAAGREHLAARRFDAAAAAVEEAAARAEIPDGALALRLARAHLEAGRPDAAAARAIGVVETDAGFTIWAAAAGLLARCPEDTWPGVRHRLRVGLVGTWTTHTFAPLLRLAAARHGLALDIRQPPYGQYFNATLDPASELMATAPDVLVLAPDHRALGLRPFSDTAAADVAAEIDRWAGVWDAVRRTAAPTLVQLGVAAPGADPLGHYAAGQPGARASQIAALNAGLAGRAAAADVGFVDVARLAARAGQAAWFDPRGWRRGRGRRPGSTRAAGTWPRSPTVPRRCRCSRATPRRCWRPGSGCRGG